MNGLDLLGAHLRQRRELGEHELLFEALGRDVVVELLRRARAGAPAGGTASAVQTRVPAASNHPSSPGGEVADRSVAGAALAVGRVAPAHDLSERRVASGGGVPPAAVEAPAAGAMVQLGDLAEVRATAQGCTRCGLASTRRTVVFGEGNERARVMVVGEAPGSEEDRTGRPFVGRAGKLLDRLLAAVGFPRESVYICNVLKCRPPGNRDPRPEEIEACSPYLRRQLELIAPEVILTVGTFPSQTLLGSTEPINRLRGQVHDYHGTPLVPTYHPAALLRNRGWIRPAWEDLQRLREVIDGKSALV